MKTYSIVKVGNDYVVRVDDLAVLTLTSRRRAARLVADATGLLSAAENLAEAETSEATTVPSMPRDRPEVS
jgi:hypothetical protein